MSAKYVHNSHPMSVKIPKSASHVWKRMAEFRELAESHITWEINAGNLSSLWDNWLGPKAFGESPGIPSYPISFFIKDGTWDVIKLLKWMDNFPINRLNPRGIKPSDLAFRLVCWKM